MNDFAVNHPDCRGALANWYKLMSKENFANIQDLRKVFPHADKVGKFTVFNIGGNKCRLIVAIHYNRFKVYIRHVLTHSEYDTNHWKIK